MDYLGSLRGIDKVAAVLQERIEGALGPHLLGIYLVGSLAVGDFDPASSDIDLIVVTDEALEVSRFMALKAMHAEFAESASPWAKRLEVVYAPKAALHVPFKPLPGDVPQLEKGTALFSTPLEDGWIFQCWTLRERGLIVCGPSPKELDILTPREAMAEAVRAVAAQWLHDAEHDGAWLMWLRERENHLFVVQTLCRLLYSLETDEVTSKPRALAWAVEALPEPWAGLVSQAAAGQPDVLDDAAVATTLALIRYTYEESLRSLGG